MADDTDDLHDQVLAMADRLKLTGNDRRKYIHEHMTRGGFRMEPTYVKDDGDDDDDDRDPFFGKSSGSRSASRRRSRDDDDDRGSRSGRSRGDRRGGPDSWYS